MAPPDRANGRPVADRLAAAFFDVEGISLSKGRDPVPSRRRSTAGDVVREARCPFKAQPRVSDYT
jgi:hypothetical protein